MKWMHFTITDALPGSAWGTGGIGLADFDGSSSLDVAVSNFFLPGTGVEYHLSWRNVAEVELSLYRVDLVGGIDLTDGLRVSFADGSVIHLRPSGNAPELRCYVEAESREVAEALLAEALAMMIMPKPLVVEYLENALGRGNGRMLRIATRGEGIGSL